MAEIVQPKIQEIEVDGPRTFEWASEKQKLAVEMMPGSPILLIGGFNSSKSTTAILRGLALCDNFPGYKIGVLRKTFKDLSFTTRPTFDQWIDPKRTTQSSATEVTLDNGSSFIFHHLDSPNSATILKGLEINAAILDQAEQMQERTFTVLLGRLGRWKGARVPKWILDSYPGAWPWRNQDGQPIPPVDIVLTANPTEDGDPELHWLWQRFSPDSKAYQEKWSRQGYRQLVMPTKENKFAGEQNIKILEQQDDDYVRRFMLGEWVRSKGHIFRLNDDSILDYDPALISRIENTMVLGRALDHGDSAPTACLWYGIDQYHNLIVYREYYRPGIDAEGNEHNVADHRNAIAAISGNLTYRINLADPSIFNKTRNITGFTRKAQRWCLDPSTPILTTDLRHIPVGLLRVGQHIAGFDEGNTSERFRDRGGRTLDRYWREAVVESVGRAVLPSYRITLSDDTVLVCSEDHKWLCNPTSQWRIWRKTSNLRVGENLLRATDVWEPESSYGSGYLAAAFDGEGHLTQCYDDKTQRTTNRLGFNQLENNMLDRVEYELRSRNFTYSRCKQSASASKTGRPTVAVGVNRRPEIMRLLGTVRPSRLLPKFNFNVAGRVQVISKPTIVGIEYLGPMEMVTIGTSTKTLIASGLMSHNSVAEEYQQHRIGMSEKTKIFWSPADNNEALSRQRLSQRLRVDPNHKNPITGEMGAPYIYFVKQSDDWPNGVSHAISEIRAAKRVQVAENDGRAVYSDERDPVIPDHSLDCVRYIVNSSTMPASAPVQDKSMVALAKADGRVMITLPPIQDRQAPPPLKREPRGWKSRSGGY